MPIIHLYTSGIELSLLIIWQRKFTLNKSGKYYYNNFKELSSSAGTWEEQQGEEKRKNQQQNSKRKKKINKNRVKKMLIHYENFIKNIAIVLISTNLNQVLSKERQPKPNIFSHKTHI